MTTYFRRFPATHNVANYAALQALPGSAGDTVTLAGASSPNDGGEGSFTWRVGSATGDGGTIFPGPPGSGGYWERAGLRYLLMEFFGGSTDLEDNYDAMMACLNISVAAGIPVRVRSGRYRFKRPIILPPAMDQVSPALSIIGDSEDYYGGLTSNCSVLEYTTGDGTDFIKLAGFTSAIYQQYSITLRYLAIVGPDLPSNTATSGHGVFLEYGWTPGPGGVGNIDYGPNNFPTIEYCTFQGFGGGAGLKCMGSNTGHLSKLLGRMNRDGFWLDFGFNGNTVTNIQGANNYRFGCYFGNSYGTTFTGGLMQGNGQYGLVVDRCFSNTVMGMYFESNNPSHSTNQAALWLAGESGVAGFIDSIGITANNTFIGLSFGQAPGDRLKIQGTSSVPTRNTFIGCRQQSTGMIDSTKLGYGTHFLNCGPIDVGVNNAHVCLDEETTQQAGRQTRGGDPFRVSTHDATPITMLSQTVPDDRAVHCIVTVMARRIGGVRGTGAVGDTLTFKKEFAAIKNGAGATPAILSPATTTTWELPGTDLTTAGISVTCTGTASGVIMVTVTGAVNLSVTWSAHIEFLAKG